MRYFCTYFDRHYLTRGLVLYWSLVENCQHPFVLWVLCFDAETHQILSRLALPHVQLITEQEFEAGDVTLVGAKADRTRVEYYWTCTASLPLYIFHHHAEVESIFYLDADLCFYSDPQPIYAEFGANSILIIEHRRAPALEHFKRQYGIYNVGLVGFRRDEAGLACLQSWRRDCIAWCHSWAEDGKFGDQNYLDDWPLDFPNVVVLQHLGAGLGPWNIARYAVHVSEDKITVNGQALIFYHFHRYVPVLEHLLDPYGDIYEISPHQARMLYLPYAQALQRAECYLCQMAPEISATLARPLRQGIVNALASDPRLAVPPPWLFTTLWWFLHRRLATHKRLKMAFISYKAGNLPLAARQFLATMLFNPFFFLNGLDLVGRWLKDKVS